MKYTELKNFDGNSFISPELTFPASGLPLDEIEEITSIIADEFDFKLSEVREFSLIETIKNFKNELSDEITIWDYCYDNEQAALNEQYKANELIKEFEKGQWREFDITLKAKNLSGKNRTFTISNQINVNALINFLKQNKGERQDKSKGRPKKRFIKSHCRLTANMAISLINRKKPGLSQNQQYYFVGLILATSGFLKHPREIKESKNDAYKKDYRKYYIQNVKEIMKG